MIWELSFWQPYTTQTTHWPLPTTKNSALSHSTNTTWRSQDTQSKTSCTVRPSHISIRPVTGQLIIADFTNKAIVVYDTQGNVQNTVTVQTKVGYMWCAGATGDGYVILDGSNSGRMHWVDSQGTVTHTYGSREGEGLCKPRHMVRTSWGQLVVADTDNNRLHLVDANGELSYYLLTRDDGIEQPFCVWLDEATSLLYKTHRPGDHWGSWVYKRPRQDRLQVTVGNTSNYYCNYD